MLACAAFFFGLDLLGEVLGCGDFDDVVEGGAVELSVDAEVGGAADWAPAWNNPGAKRKSASAKTETANLRTDPHLNLKVWTHHT